MVTTKQACGVMRWGSCCMQLAEGRLVRSAFPPPQGAHLVVVGLQRHGCHITVGVRLHQEVQGVGI